jgi:hypothetical protein
VKIFLAHSGVCTNATAPSVSSINRILRNRAAERAAAEFARAAGYGLYPPHAYPGFPWPAAPTHMWGGSPAMPNMTSPGSASTPRTLGSPNSGSHDTLGSPDGNRLIGECAGMSIKDHLINFNKFNQISRVKTHRAWTATSQSSAETARPSVPSSWKSWRRSSTSRTIPV